MEKKIYNIAVIVAVVAAALYLMAGILKIVLVFHEKI
jgi:hypothetical protein